ncbi:hypothetical protein KXW38_000910, partial [Aspergillus fumigatus]
PDPAPHQRPRGRHALWRGRDVVRADLQGDAGRQFCARRAAAGRRLGVLGAARQIQRVVLDRHADDAGIHVRLRHRDPGHLPAPDDRRADHFRHHGDDRPVDRVPGGAEMDLWRQPATLSARVREPVDEPVRPADPDRLCHEPRGVARHDGRDGLVLPRVEIRPCHARHRLQPAGRAIARHF